MSWRRRKRNAFAREATTTTQKYSRKLVLYGKKHTWKITFLYKVHARVRILQPKARLLTSNSETCTTAWIPWHAVRGSNILWVNTLFIRREWSSFAGGRRVFSGWSLTHSHFLGGTPFSFLFSAHFSCVLHEPHHHPFLFHGSNRGMGLRK